MLITADTAGTVKGWKVEKGEMIFEVRGDLKRVRLERERGCQERVEIEENNTRINKK